MKEISKKTRLTFIISFLTLIILAGSFLVYRRFTSAGSAVLYPGSCLGSWQNSYLAQGQPETQELQFITKENSAVFSEGGIKEIYCGSFNGDLSENEIKLIKNVNLKFSWLVTDEELKTATSSIVIIQPPATSSEEVAQNTDYIINQILNNINADEVQLIISTTTPEIMIIVNTVNSEVATSSEINPVENTAAIVPVASSEATSSSTSFWWRKLNFFFADDQVNNMQQEVPIFLPSGDLSQGDESISAAATSSLDSPLAPTEDFLKVSYTLDGIDWQALGTVNKSNWQDLSFEIPVYQLEDVKKIQIKIESLPILNKTPFVYLDGMALEVEYESETLTQDESSASSTSLTKPLKVRNLQKDIILDEKATHSCRAEPFRLDISGKPHLTTTLILKNSLPAQAGGKQEPEEIEIGSLPIGIDIVFSKNRDYIYQPLTGENTLELEITSEPGSQKGSFGIPIIYTEKGASDSTTVCQINVVNF